MPAFDSVASALRTLDQLGAQPPRSRGRWDVPHVLHHIAQSIEYSMQGYPALKPAWFRASVGAYAFSLFSAGGQMTHNLAEPIPGAPDIAQGQPLAPAARHAIAALQAFARHSGPLAPHFAYGTLDKATYTRAHLMHLADHWNEAAAA